MRLKAYKFNEAEHGIDARVDISRPYHRLSDGARAYILSVDARNFALVKLFGSEPHPTQEAVLARLQDWAYGRC